jgi:hypothetical protein
MFLYLTNACGMAVNPPWKVIVSKTLGFIFLGKPFVLQLIKLYIYTYLVLFIIDFFFQITVQANHNQNFVVLNLTY